MLRIIAAHPVEIDDRTDIRQEIGDPAGEKTLDYLNRALLGNALVLIGGLMGWGRYTHTCHSGMGKYHVEVEVHDNLTLRQILALPELVALRQEIQEANRSAAIEWQHKDAWQEMALTGRVYYTEAERYVQRFDTYVARVNELCQANGLPPYITTQRARR